MSLFASAKVELEFTGGSWTDVSAYQGEPIVITNGRPTPYDDVTPATATVILRNDDGRFTPENSSSPYYPNMRTGIRMRVSVIKSAVTYTRFTGYITALAGDFMNDADVTGFYITVTASDSLAILAARVMHSHWAERAISNARALGTWAECYVPNASNVRAGAIEVYSIDQGGTHGSAATQPNVNVGNMGWVTPDSQLLATEGGITGSSDMTSGGTYSQWSLIRIAPRTPMNYMAFGIYAPPNIPVSVNGEFIIYAKTGGTGGTMVFNCQWMAVSAVAAGYWYNSSSTRQGTFAGLAGFWHVIELQIKPGTPTTMQWRQDGGGWTDISSCDLRTIDSYDINMTQGLITSGIFASGSASTLIDYTELQQKTWTTANRVSFFQSAVADFAPGFATAGSDSARTVYTGYWSNRTALDVAKEIQRSNGGIVWARPDGTVVFAHPDTLRPLAPLLTIDMDADMLGKPTMLLSDDTRPTRVATTSPAGASTAVDVDTEAVAPIGRRRDISLATVNTTSADMFSLGWARMLHTSRRRFTSITLDLLSANTDYTSTILSTSGTLGALFPTQRLRIATPSSLFGVSNIDVYVYGWTETYAHDTATITFDVEAATTATVTGGSCVGNTSTGTVIVTTDATFPTNAQAYPMDLDWAGERITVSAPGGSTSPQTFTVTARGVTGGTAATSHISGTSIDAWIAGA